MFNGPKANKLSLKKLLQTSKNKITINFIISHMQGKTQSI